MTESDRGGFTIEESARRLGNYRWVSMRLFELLGSWVVDVPQPALKVQLAAASRHHGWHAELLGERLPAVRDLHPDRQTAPPNDEFAGLVADLVRLDRDDTVGRLVAVYRVVVPHLIAVGTWHLERCTPVADAAVSRTLRFVLADQIDDWRAAEGALHVLCDDDAALLRAGDIRLSFERRLLASGGISGPGTMVDPSDVVGRSSSGVADVDVGVVG